MPHTENGKVFEEFIYERISYDKNAWINLTPYILLEKPTSTGQRYRHTQFIPNFKKTFNKNPTDVINREINPDLVFYNPALNKAIIIEIKIQTTNGSVDEKLQTPAAKLFILKKIFNLIDCHDVYYYYILDNDSYNKNKYKDTYDYIDSEVKNCKYFFAKEDFLFELK